MLNKPYEELDRYCEDKGAGDALGWSHFFARTPAWYGASTVHLRAPSGRSLMKDGNGEWHMLLADGSPCSENLGAIGDFPDLRAGCPVKSLLKFAKNMAEQAIREMDYDASRVAHGALCVSELMNKAAAFALAAEFLEG